VDRLPNNQNLKSNCSLCFLKEKTLWLKKFFGPFWKVVICETCKVPMVIYKWHTISLLEEHKKQMIESLKMAAKEFFGTDDFYVDEERRNIKDHWHAHARKGKGK